jgi:HAD-superfamily hydrolase (TIGR02245 family)
MDDDIQSTVSATSSETIYCSSHVLSSAFSPLVPSGSSLPSSSDPNPLGGLSTASTDTETDRPVSPARPGADSIFMKLQRLASRTEILFINQPRHNTKLLVLDLDHTLMDFSCRFDYMVEQLKRPYLDAFLAQSYLYYDIAVWSQTNFKWLELKLTELGMLNRGDYKICFALVSSFPVALLVIATHCTPSSHSLMWTLSYLPLPCQDKSTMFTVRQQYVKPLEVIWAKCASLGWGPHNTVHVDDLERNFELNKQSGVLISPFHLKPFTVNPNTVDLQGESILDGTAVASPATVINDFEGSLTDNADMALDDKNDPLDDPDCDLDDAEIERVDRDDSSPNKSFEDIELLLLARYDCAFSFSSIDFVYVF